MHESRHSRGQSPGGATLRRARMPSHPGRTCQRPARKSQQPGKIEDASMNGCVCSGFFYDWMRVLGVFYDWMRVLGFLLSTWRSAPCDNASRARYRLSPSSPSSLPAPASTSLTNPKSPSFRRPDGDTYTFSGLTSLCTTPCWCM